jgi:hypothetical protein
LRDQTNRTPAKTFDIARQIKVAADRRSNVAEPSDKV